MHARHGLRINSSVRKVLSALAKESPGPAIPTTVICGTREATARTFFTPVPA
jgi:hypothetical protein